MEGISVDTVLIVSLYKAIENDDPKIIHKKLPYDDFEELVSIYIELEKNDTSILTRRKEALELRVYMTLGCLTVLEQEVADKEVMEILRQQKWTMRMDYYQDDLKTVKKGIVILADKLKRLENDTPKKKKVNSKVSIYDVLASMSAGLDGIYLDPRIVTISEFISYQKVLDRKAEQYEKIKK